MIGKTGTTDGNKDTWMSGASTKVATVVGVMSVTGDRDQRTTTFASGSAATARHRMWPAVMSVANAKFGGDAFPAATGAIVNAVQVPIPDLRGKSLSEAQTALEAAGFLFVDGGLIDSELPGGTVAKTDPAGGTSTNRGSSVTVYTSNASQIVVPDVVGKSEGEARSTLGKFAVVKTDGDTTDTSQVGKVISMTPAAGGGAKPGDTITIVIGKLAATPKAGG
jgi:membrane peptidoglycan carboxypeptidase